VIDAVTEAHVVGVPNWFIPRENARAERFLPSAYAAVGFSSTSATP